MKNKINFKNFIVYLVAVTLIFLAAAVNVNNTTPLIFISKQDTTINLNSTFYKYFNLGLRRLISSTLWVATILESDTEHYKEKNYNSWMFLRFKSISELEPKFYENYTFGGVYLSIVKDDLKGASYIYEKGILIYPNDFELLKQAAFHFHFEVGDFKKSALFYDRIKKSPKTNAQMLSTLARIESQNGNLEVAYIMLSEFYNKTPNKDTSPIAKNLFSHLYSIKAEIDLKCLNLNLSNCQKIDLEGEPYFIEDGHYRAKKSWTLFRIKNKATP